MKKIINVATVPYEWMMSQGVNAMHVNVMKNSDKVVFETFGGLKELKELKGLGIQPQRDYLDGMRYVVFMVDFAPILEREFMAAMME